MQCLQKRSKEVSFGFENADKAILTFRGCALQCLIVQNYIKEGIHLLQGLLTHLEGEYMNSLDSQANFWIFTGTTVRVALMNGLNRDPSHYVNLTPFESEMRRRLWLCIVHCDVVLSFQMGLPSMTIRRCSPSEKPTRGRF